MKLQALRERLALAEQNAARGRELIVRQNALVVKLGLEGKDTGTAEVVLETLKETQRLQYDLVAALIDGLKATAPEEWEAQYAPLPGERNNEGNQLLNSLPIQVLSLIQPLLESVRLRRGQRVQIAKGKMKHILFPESGMISVVAVNGGGHKRMQVGLIAREGMVGLPILFGLKQSPFDMEVEVEGTALSVATEALSEFIGQNPIAREVFLRALYDSWVHFAELAAANAQGTIEQRLAHLLLLVQDRLDTAIIRLTHEQIATMMTVRRAGVTVALEQLEAEGSIARSRGAITVLDRAGLDRKAA